MPAWVHAAGHPSSAKGRWMRLHPKQIGPASPFGWRKSQVVLLAFAASLNARVAGLLVILGSGEDKKSWQKMDSRWSSREVGVNWDGRRIPVRL